MRGFLNFLYILQSITCLASAVGSVTKPREHKKHVRGYINDTSSESDFSLLTRRMGSANLHALQRTILTFHKIVKAATNNDFLEGFMAVSPEQLRFYLEAGNTPWANNICEVGFNGGHSAFALMFGSLTSSLVSFDLMNKSFQPTAMMLIKGLFGNERVDFVTGDSTVTIPKYSFKQGLCDVFSIDGGHSYEVATADINSFIKFSSCENIVLMDDIFQKLDVHHVDGAKNAWLDAIKNKKIKQYGCYEYFYDIPDHYVDPGVGNWKRVPRAFCVGSFIVADCKRSPKAEMRILDILAGMELNPCATGCCN